MCSRRLRRPRCRAPAQPDDFFAIDADAAALVSVLAARRNDLEVPAIKLQPVIADVLAALRASPGCLLARMSGSGATCFGLFGSAATPREDAAQRTAARASSGWWVARDDVFG